MDASQQHPQKLFMKMKAETFKGPKGKYIYLKKVQSSALKMGWSVKGFSASTDRDAGHLQEFKSF